MLRSSRHKKLQNQTNEEFFRKYNTIYRIKCYADNKIVTEAFHKIIYIMIRLFFTNKLKILKYTS